MKKVSNMCGIVGYIGEKEKRDFLINGLKELEYRGYDSAGIAILKNGEINSFKANFRFRIRWLVLRINICLKKNK